MSKSKPTIVSTATIRAAFVGDNATLDPSQVMDAKGKPVSTASLLGADGTGQKVRGRLNTAFVTAYLAANPTHAFGEGNGTKRPDVTPAPASRTVSIPRTGKNGRALAPVVLPVSEAKALAGVSGKRGRLSSDEKVAAGKAFQAANAKA